MNRSRLFRLATCLCLIFLSCGLTAPLLARPSAQTQPAVISLWHDLTAWLRAVLVGELSTSPMADPYGNTGTTSSGEGPSIGPMADPIGKASNTGGSGDLNTSPWVDPIG